MMDQFRSVRVTNDGNELRGNDFVTDSSKSLFADAPQILLGEIPISPHVVCSPRHLLEYEYNLPPARLPTIKLARHLIRTPVAIA